MPAPPAVASSPAGQRGAPTPPTAPRTAEETGPVFLDEDEDHEEQRPEPARQPATPPGFGAPPDDPRGSDPRGGWNGAPRETPEPRQAPEPHQTSEPPRAPEPRRTPQPSAVPERTVGLRRSEVLRAPEAAAAPARDEQEQAPEAQPERQPATPPGFGPPASDNAPVQAPRSVPPQAAPAQQPQQQPPQQQPQPAPGFAQPPRQPAPSAPPVAQQAQQTPQAPQPPQPQPPQLPQQAQPTPQQQQQPQPQQASAPPSWAQPPAEGAGLPAQGGGPDAVTPWKPPVEDPFAAAARQHARPAGLGKRFCARLVDLVLTLAVAGGVAFPFVGKVTDHIDAKVDAVEQAGETKQVWLLDGTTGGYLALVLGVVLVFGLLYEVLPTARWGRTLGKKLFGLSVVNIEGHDTPGFATSLLRWLTYGVLGVLVIGVVNVLWCVFDRPWRQCWHDKTAKTFVAAA